MQHVLTLPAQDFSEIQAKLGLTDVELGQRLRRGPVGGEVVRQFRTGERAVPAEIAVLMCAMERDFDNLEMVA